MTQNGGYYNASYVTGIQEITYSLSRLYSNDYSYIANIENQWLNNNSFSNLTLSLFSVFKDILNSLGIPTNTIQLLYDNLFGSFSNATYSNNSYLSMQTAFEDYYNYDALDYGSPIVYQLARSIPCYGTYAYSTSVVYKTLCSYPSFDPVTGIFQGYATTTTFYDAGTASSTATVYVQ